MRTVGCRNPCRRAAAAVLGALLLCLAVWPSCAIPQTKSAASDNSGFRPDLVRASIVDAHPTFVDPRTGMILWTATIVKGHTTSAGLLVGELDGVQGVFYDKGKPADSFKAAKALYDDKKRIVTAFGGVEVVSLIQKSTTLTCDSLKWTIANDKLVGTGHVLYKTARYSQAGSSFSANTKLEDLVMPAPGLPDSTPGRSTIQL